MLSEDDLTEGVRRCLCIKYPREAQSPDNCHWSELQCRSIARSVLDDLGVRHLLGFEAQRALG